MTRFRKKSASIVFTLLLLLGICLPYGTAFADGSLYNVSGTITLSNNATGQDITATLTDTVTNAVYSSSITDNGNGTYGYTFNNNLADGSYTFNVTASGYTNYSTPISISGSNITGNDITLTTTSTSASTNSATDYVVSGIVDNAAGDPITNATISVADQNSVTTDTNGNYSLNLPNGTYTLNVSASGYQSGTLSITVADADVSDQNITLTTAATDVVSGTITDTSGNPVPNATISVDGQSPVTSAADGSYSLNLPNGTYTINVSASGYQSGTLSITVADANLSNQNISLTASAPVIVNTPTFSDITGHWAQNDIEFMVQKGFVSGMTNTTFAPNEPVTRAMFTAMLVNVLKPTTAGSINFTDVPSDAWYAKSVGLAYGAGLVKGISADQFAPNQTISREQMAAMIANALKYKGLTTSNTDDSSLSKFADNASISSWAKDSAAQAVANGILNGINQNGQTVFAPGQTATRAEAAVMLKNLYTKLQ